MGEKFQKTAMVAAATVPPGAAQSSWHERPQSNPLKAGEVAPQHNLYQAQTVAVQDRSSSTGLSTQMGRLLSEAFNVRAAQRHVTRDIRRDMADSMISDRLPGRLQTFVTRCEL
eukprot:3174585-Amphidinium_carterae.1